MPTAARARPTAHQQQGQRGDRNRRQRRHANQPGQVQLQEAKSKAGSGAPAPPSQISSSLSASSAMASPFSGGRKRQVIHAMLKGQVVLPCNLEPPEPGDAVSLVLWYKDKSMVPIFSVDARSAPVEEARHKPGPWLEGRALLKISAARAPQRARRQAEAPTLAEGGQQANSTTTGGGSGEPGRLWRRRRRRRARKNHAGQEPALDQSLARLVSARPKASSSQPVESPFSALERRRRPIPSDDEPSEAGGDDELAGRTNAGSERQQVVEALPSPLGLVAAGASSQQPREPLIARLHIDSLSSEDNGLYLCRVDFRKARSRTQEALLKIIVPADKPTIRDVTDSRNQEEPSSASRSLVGPHNEGAKVVLECETQGGYPEPALTWWRDGRLIDDSYEIVSASDGRLVARFGDDLEPAAAPSAVLVEAAGDNEERQEERGLEESSSSGELLGSSGALASLPADSPTTLATAADTDGPAPSQGASAAPPEPGSPGKQVAQNRLIRNRLELANLARNDLLANYSCQARNTKLSGPPTASVMIDMNLRPIKVQIDNERQPVLADKPLEIVCRAFGSRPAALISWWRGDVRLAAGSQQHRHAYHRANSRLSLLLGDSGNSESSLEDGGQGGAHNSEQRAAATSPANTNTNSQVPVQIEEAISSDSNVTTSTLTIVPQLDDGGQIITCKAKNPKLSALATAGAGSGQPAESLEDSWKLDVHYAPRAALALGDKLNGQIQEGHDVYFECSVKAHPQAHEVRWWFEGKELETNLSSGVIISNQSLVLQRVSRHQRGRYTCSAINSVGESHSNSLHLRVQYAPFCRDSSPRKSPPAPAGDQSPQRAGGDSLEATEGALSQQRAKAHYGAARLESVKVYCHVDADPADSIVYKWAFVSAKAPGPANSQSAGSSGKQQSPAAKWQPELAGQQKQLVHLDSSFVSSLAPENPLTSVATYTPRSELDYGSLLCWASNALGQQAEPCVYQVVPAERPDPVRNCRLVNASDTQLMVACEPGYDGGVDQSFQMEVYDTRKRELVANVSSAPILSGADGSPGGYSSGGVINLLGFDLDGAQNNTPAYQDDPAAGSRTSESGNGDDTADSVGGRAHSASGSSAGGGQQPASLVSEPVGAASRQQKQRHSNSANSGSQKAAATSSRQQRLEGAQTLFITEPSLRPATDYFLSIYSANSKGSSKPVAFTASTLNPPIGSAGDTGADFALSSRDSRRSADSSHLFSDVLALSWNPFLLVCAATLGLFAVFASITFALMKYVDFSTGALASLGSQGLAAADAYESSGSSAGSSSSATKTGAKHQQCASPGDQLPPDSRQQLDNGSGGGDDAESGSGKGRQRARVISLADSRTVSDKEHHIPLNGIRQRAGSSLLDGTYLRSKLQQLAGQSPLKRSALKQSNSDNFLDQLGMASVVDAHRQPGQPQPSRQQQQQQRQARLRLAQLQQHQLAGAFCATLPKGAPDGVQQQQQRVAWRQQSASQQQQQPVQMQEFENPYCVKASSLATGSPSIEEGSNTTYSVATTSTSGGHHQHQSLLLAAAGEPPVEQLIISGKQYIHQTSPGYQQQRQLAHLAQQHRHLQLTGCAALPACFSAGAGGVSSAAAVFGSLQRNTTATGNLYSTKDYQASSLQQQQSARRPLVCIDHQGLASGEQQRQLDMAACLGGACPAVARTSSSSSSEAAQQAVLSYSHQQQQLYMDSQQQHAMIMEAPGVCGREVTSENYSPIAVDHGAQQADLNHSTTSNEPAVALHNETGDLASGELGTNEFDAGGLQGRAGGQHAAGCHVAHLTLVNSHGGQLERQTVVAGNGLDSGGISANGGGYVGRGQLVTLGSPSGGVDDLYDQQTINDISPQRIGANHHYHQYLSQQASAGSCSQATQAGSNSTITSVEQQQHEQPANLDGAIGGGGNVIGVLGQQQARTTSADREVDGRMFAQSALRNPKQAQTAQVVGTSGLRQAKKSFHPNGKANCERGQQQPQDFSELQSQLERQYTMYVAPVAASIRDSLESDHNNNGCPASLGEFYLLSTQNGNNSNSGSHVDVGKTRVRLIGSGNDRTSESDLHTDV